MLLFGCSTSGGIYKKGDDTHGEFSVGRTALSVFAVIGLVAAAAAGGGGGGGSYGHAWDYQPGNGQWVCRNRSNGQYAYTENCSGLAMVDNWP